MTDKDLHKKNDCPQCGQDMRLSPDAEDEIECARLDGYAEGFEAGQREAYEDAAKMARAHAHLSSPDCPTSDHTVVDCPEWISNEIRQKANELYDNPVQKGKK